MDLLSVYEALLDRFGRQGWWPMSNGFSPPEWEVCLGAILTQNTNWRNVELALANLRVAKVTGPREVMETSLHELERLIRPSGFYSQKAERLRHFAAFVLGFGGFEKFSADVTRPQLLGVSGLGPETADSILLYALGRPVFVIDAYTRRVFKRLGIDGMNGYEEWRGFFEENLPRDVDVYREFHALIVELAKADCRKDPSCGRCVLSSKCARRNLKSD
ncbi:MAG: endonuclease III domain-containing protein [Candidatus Aenigmarchaeota archaeon]|nr:endonuclease III domain-containing protein [Candidatus Aenigmarchaeota archaeon]